jgi:hypothetical protein
MNNKILKIKWENIFLIITIICSIIAIIKHIILGQVFDRVVYEIMIYGLIDFITWYVIKSIREELKQGLK